MTPERKQEIADQMFNMANELGGDETGHLAAIVHSVVSELWNPEIKAFDLIDKARAQLALLELMRAGR